MLPGGGARLGHAERGTFPAGGEAERSPCHRQLRGPARGPAQRYEVRAAGGAQGGAKGAECRTGGWCRCRCRCHAAAGGLLSSAPSPRGLQRSVPNPAIASRCRRGGRDPGGGEGVGDTFGPPPGQPATPGPTHPGGAVPCIPPAWRCHRVARGSGGVHVRRWLRLCGRARGSAEAPPKRQRRAPPGPPAPAASGSPGYAGRPGTGRGAPADLRADQAAAGGDQHGLVLQPGHRHGRGVPARVPLDLPELRRGVRVSRASGVVVVGGVGVGSVPCPQPLCAAPFTPLSVLQVPGEAFGGGAGPPLAPRAPRLPRCHPLPATGLHLPAPPRPREPAPGPPSRLYPRGVRVQLPPGPAPSSPPPQPGAGGQAGPPQLRDPHAADAGGPCAPGGAAPLHLAPRLRRTPPHPSAPATQRSLGATQPPRPGTKGPWGCAGGLEPHAAPGGHRGWVPAAPWAADPPWRSGTPPAQPDLAPCGG